MADRDKAPIIVKRRRKAEPDAPHGGAWKVAYADFVTAMMAFFMLMWLLNATTEDQRKGLAEYFDPRIPVSRVSGGGAGALGGDSVFAEDTMAQSGTGASGQRSASERKASGDTGSMPDGASRDGLAEEFASVENAFRGMAGESLDGDDLLRHVRTRLTDEGLVIELFDAADRPLFRRSSSKPTPRMEVLLAMVGEVLTLVVNPVAVVGHTDSTPFASRGGGYGNWELSSDRAHAARRALEEAGVAADRLARVTGKADADPAFAGDPADPRNRRVEITLLRSDLPAQAR
ncbi:MAG TPA: flagellar motor protein MotB [Paracoccaceae bacterium]|nr:flagellar motor protein MotB [Paracoccaceae bacterium]